MRGQVGVLGLGPAPVDLARSLAPGATGALLGRGPADDHRDQPGEAPAVVGARLAGQSGVDDGAHAGDGQGRLGDRVDDDHPAPRCRASARGPGPGRQPPVQRADVGVDAGQPRDDPETSPTPGRKTSTSPACSASARRTHAATWSRKRGVTPRSSLRRTPVGRGHQHLVDRVQRAGDGDQRRAAEQGRGALGLDGRGHGDQQQVGPEVARTSTSIARVRSASSWRSCTSSSTTAVMPGSSGSRCRRRSRTPVVTTSMRVRAPTCGHRAPSSRRSRPPALPAAGPAVVPPPGRRSGAAG